MNRRNFFKSLAIATASLSILPSALTYKRTWVKTAGSGVWVVNPDWMNAPYEMQLLWGHDEWLPVIYNREKSIRSVTVDGKIFNLVRKDNFSLKFSSGDSGRNPILPMIKSPA